MYGDDDHKYECLARALLHFSFIWATCPFLQKVLTINFPRHCFPCMETTFARRITDVFVVTKNDSFTEFSQRVRMLASFSPNPGALLLSLVHIHPKDVR